MDIDRRTRTVARIIDPQPTLEGAGVKLKRSIGGWALDYLDPFLLLDHFESDDPSDYLAGFPLHPHRGIETVTYMLAGDVDHSYTLGHAGTIGPGGNAKRYRLAELALRQKIPLVMLLEGAGFRPSTEHYGRSPADLIAQAKC